MRSKPPYGRPPLPEIPVPPFTGDEEQRFRRDLGVYVATLGGARGPDLAVVALAGVVSTMPLSDASGRLTRQALELVLSVSFPVPWTPHGLVETMAAAGLLAYVGTVRPDWISVSGDPDFLAERHPDGSWTTRWRERGVERPDAELGSDDDLVLHLADTFGPAHPYPFGWATDDVDVDRLRASSHAAARAFDRHATLPYLAAWKQE